MGRGRADRVLLLAGADALAELLGGLLQANRRHLAVDCALPQQQHKLLAKEGKASHGNRGLVWVELGDPIDEGADGHVTEKEFVDGGGHARRPAPHEL